MLACQLLRSLQHVAECLEAGHLTIVCCAEVCTGCAWQDPKRKAECEALAAELDCGYFLTNMMPGIQVGFQLGSRLIR